MVLDVRSQNASSEFFIISRALSEKVKSALQCVQVSKQTAERKSDTHLKRSNNDDIIMTKVD